MAISFSIHLQWGQLNGQSLLDFIRNCGTFASFNFDFFGDRLAGDGQCRKMCFCLSKGCGCGPAHVNSAFIPFWRAEVTQLNTSLIGIYF